MSEATSSENTARDLRETLESCIARLDRSEAVRVALVAVREGAISVADLHTTVLGPMLASIGTRWQHSNERVWEEHYASHVIRTIVEAVYPEVEIAAAEIPKVGSTVLLACPPREQHEIGLRMLADRFELAGWDVVFLGADTPLAEIAAAARAVGAALVALSVATVVERVDVRRYMDELHALLPGTRIVIGGPAFARHREGWVAEELLDPSELGLPGSTPEE